MPTAQGGPFEVVTGKGDGQWSDAGAPGKAAVVTVETPGLGDRSYIVHDGSVAAVVDPQRDIDRVVDEVESLGVRVTHVLETHLHNDYVTGGYALAEHAGAEYVVPGGDDVSFPRRAVADGDELAAGDLVIEALHTPGHTPHHMAYVVRVGEEPEAVLTGGSMLYGAVGRTDLIGRDRTEALTRAQYRSVRRLAAELPGNVPVYPTHGFGSFCSATETSGDRSTIADERARNVALVTEDEDRFVEQLVAGLGAYPRYYAHMGPRNAAGPSAPDLSVPAPVDPEVLRRRLDEGEWVVDLRQRRAFARRHVAGTVSIELADSFATYFGWVLPWQAPVTLLGDSAEQLQEARRQLVRIGVDELAGAMCGAVGSAAGPFGGYGVATFDELATWYGSTDRLVLDVRSPEEWRDGHLAEARHIAIWELADRLGELPDTELWVHCASGYRAAIGASLVARAGRHVVLVDDDWQRAPALGLPIAKGR